jgi:hypothetical protein
MDGQLKKPQFNVANFPAVKGSGNPVDNPEWMNGDSNAGNSEQINNRTRLQVL